MGRLCSVAPNRCPLAPGVTANGKGSGTGPIKTGQMTQVVVPVRYPPNEHSLATLAEAVRIARERDAELTVLHVDLYHDSRNVTRRELKRAVQDEIGDLPDVRYVVRRGLLVEETILEEVAAQGADVVVIGKQQAGRWRRMVRRLVDDPNIEHFLESELDTQVITVGGA